MYINLAKKTAILRELKDKEIVEFFVVSKLESATSKEAIAKLRTLLAKDDYLVIVAR
jgi:hypothetical protein